MALTYWDPKNLFQITDLDNATFIQCVGHDRRGLRCKWTLDDGDLERVNTLVARLSQKKPSNVTAEELRSLASFSLCAEYHKNQSSLVTSRWTRALGLAKRHYELATASGSATVHPFTPALTPPPEEIIALKHDARRLQQRLDEALGEIGRLKRTLSLTEGVLAVSNRDRDAASLRSAEAQERMSKDIVRLQNLVCKYEADEKNARATQESNAKSMKATEKNMKAMEADMAASSKTWEILEKDRTMLRGLVEELSEDLKKSRGELESSREEAGSLKSQLEVVNKDLHGSQEQLKAALQHADSLRGEVSVLEAKKAATESKSRQLTDDGAAVSAENRRLAAELEASRQSLQACAREVDSERQAKVEVGSQAQALRDQICELERGISACWMHNFCARVNRIRKPSSRHAAQEVLA